MIELLNQYGREWFEPLGLALIQNTIFMVLILLVLHWLRDTPARVRYIIALIGLLKLVIPPFVPVHSPVAAAYTELASAIAIPSHAIPLTAVTASNEPASLSLAGLLFGVWCVVAAAVLVHALTTTLGLRMALRHAVPAGDDESRQWLSRTGFRVRVTGRVPVPMTVGLFPRTIFVPPQWSSWPAPAKRAVLRHETAHILGHDGLVRTLQTVVRSLYWFHPLVPLLARRINVFREQICDETAAHAGAKGRFYYSRVLLDIADNLMQQRGVRGSASTLMKQRSELFDRIDYLTREGSAMKLTKARTAVLIITLTIAVVSLSWFRDTAAISPKDHGVVQVSLSSDNQVVVDGKKTELEKLGELLTQQITNHDAVVRIVCDDDVPMRTLFEAHAILRGAGMLKVSYGGQDGEPLPLILPSKELIEKTKSIPPGDVAQLQIAAGDVCTLDGARLDTSDISGAVAQRLAENDKLIVSLQMTPEATYGQYVRALRELKAAKANRIFIKEPAEL